MRESIDSLANSQSSFFMKFANLVWKIAYCFVFLLACIFPLFVVIPANLLDAYSTISRKYPPTWVRIGAAVFALGLAASFVPVTVEPFARIVPASVGISSHPILFGVSILFFLQILRTSRLKTIGINPYCRKCRTWFKTEMFEWQGSATDSLPTEEKLRSSNAEEPFWKNIFSSKIPGQSTRLTEHRTYAHCLSIRVCVCPSCRAGLAHLALIKPTAYYGRDGVSKGVVQTNLRFVELPEFLVDRIRSAET